MTNSPPTRQRANALMLPLAGGTALRGSGGCCAARLRSRRGHGRGAAPRPRTAAHRAERPAQPGPAPLMCRAPAGLPLARAGGGSQWQPTPAAGKLLPAYLASRETAFPRKSVASLVSRHRTAGMSRPEIPVSGAPPSPLARFVPEPGAHPAEALMGTPAPASTLAGAAGERAGAPQLLAPSPWKQPGCSGLDLCSTSAARLIINCNLIFFPSALPAYLIVSLLSPFPTCWESRRRQSCVHVGFLPVQIRHHTRRCVHVPQEYSLVCMHAYAKEVHSLSSQITQS